VLSTGATCTSSDEGGGATAPTISAQPQGQTVTAGQTATFNVTAAGTDPLSYQWRRDGVTISGATEASLTTLPTSAPDSGAKFSVVVSNSAGTVTSDEALLTVVSGQPGTLTVHARTVAGNPGAQFIAFQDGDRPWEAGPPASGDTFTFSVSDPAGRYGVAVVDVVFDPSSGVTYHAGVLVQATLAETDTVDLVHGSPAPAFGPLSVTVSNPSELEAEEGVDLSLLPDEFSPDGFQRFEGPFPETQLGQVEIGVYDVAAIIGHRPSVIVAGVTYAFIDRAYIRRNVAVPGSAAFDFASISGGIPNAFQPEARNVTLHGDPQGRVQNVNTGAVLASSGRFTGLLTLETMFNSQFDGTGTLNAMMGFPPNLAEYHGADGLEYLQAEVGSMDGEAVVTSFFHAGAAPEVTMPPHFRVTGATLATASPPRVSVTFEEEPAYPVRTFNVLGTAHNGDVSGWLAAVSAGRTAGQSGVTRTWTFPDLSSIPGWSPNAVPGKGLISITFPTGYSIGDFRQTLRWAVFERQKPQAGDVLRYAFGAGFNVPIP
jgi:Immunoglobulin I-set domain